MKEIPEEHRLSYSSANLLKGCERRYYHYKIAKTAYDSDYEDDKEYLIIGSSFHFVLESTLHSKPKNIDDYLKLCTENFKLPESQYPLLHALVIKYLRLHNKIGLECISVEDEIKNEWFLGYIDAIMRDKKGGWWVVDLKTGKTLNQFIHPRIARDTQLNLYAGFAEEIATKYNLKMKDFKGTRYRLMTKSKASIKAGEDRLSFTKRLIDLVKAYDFEIPIGKMNPKEAVSLQRDLWAKSVLIKETNKSCQNFSNCDSFWSPCPYWSQCYGNEFSKSKDEIKMVSL